MLCVLLSVAAFSGCFAPIEVSEEQPDPRASRPVDSGPDGEPVMRNFTFSQTFDMVLTSAGGISALFVAQNCIQIFGYGPLTIQNVTYNATWTAESAMTEKLYIQVESYTIPPRRSTAQTSPLGFRFENETIGSSSYLSFTTEVRVADDLVAAHQTVELKIKMHYQSTDAVDSYTFSCL
jgi:hypothetical protein